MTTTPTITTWTHHSGSFGGISPSGEAEFLRALENHGHAILTDSRYDRPMNHHTVGVGVGHDDAMFCESGQSMAAFYENGESYWGRWWDDKSSFSSGVKYYGCTLGPRPINPRRVA